MNHSEVIHRDTENLNALYRQHFGAPPGSVAPLAGGGGARRYYIISATNSKSVIGVVGPDKDENRDFLSLATLIEGAPKVYCADDATNTYIIEDLGRESLLDRVLTNPFDIQSTANLLGGLMEWLVGVQTDVDTIMYVRRLGRRFSSELVRHDLEYFRSKFLERTGIPYNADALQTDFNTLEYKVLALPNTLWGFMYRDFQGRNVLMKSNGNFGLIDFQAGMEGPGVYDVVSLLWQAKARYTTRLRKGAIERYADALAAVRPEISRHEIAQAVETIAPLRILQTLGAYGNRGLGEGKKHFLESIAAGVENLSSAAHSGMLDDYPELISVADKLSEKYPPYNTPTAGADTLTVTVESFSYRVGYPADASGNGGGFIFDCRWMHNPGRYDRYKQLTGMDEPVIQFLEEQGEIQGFMEQAETMVSAAITKYIKRGFSSLYVGFGCTGGQHRSVYSAQALASRLRERFPSIHINLRHTQQATHQSV